MARYWVKTVLTGERISHPHVKALCCDWDCRSSMHPSSNEYARQEPDEDPVLLKLLVVSVSYQEQEGSAVGKRLDRPAKPLLLLSL